MLEFIYVEIIQHYMLNQRETEILYLKNSFLEGVRLEYTYS